MIIKKIVLGLLILLLFASSSFAYFQPYQQANPNIHTPWYSYSLNHAPEPIRLHPIYTSPEHYFYAYTYQPVRRSYTPPQPIVYNPWQGYITQYYHPFYSQDFSRWDNY